MRPSFPELQHRSAFRRADWRMRRASRLVQECRYYCRDRDDEITGRTVQYLRDAARLSTSGDRPRLKERYRDIHEARLLYEAGGFRCVEIEARILARQDSCTIAL